MDLIKILPPLMIGEKEIDYFVRAFDETLRGCRRFPGPMLELALNTAKRPKRIHHRNGATPATHRSRPSLKETGREAN